jgi:outer membrane protein assembly factor BamB
VADDHAHAAVISGDAVFFGSSADDTVRCLDLQTGAERWVFWTDGPVRFAPVIAEGRVHFGSDDGFVYALDVRDGRLLWRQRPGLEDWRIPGNGRVISSWPVRTGLLVEQGIVYAAAGLYPQQGVFACAWEASTGAVRWREPLTVSPEGYLVATERAVLVPTGRASPIELDRRTGREGRTFDTGGGTFAVVHRGELFGGPGNEGSVTVQAAAGKSPGSRLVTAQGRGLVARGGWVYLIQGGELRAVDRARMGGLEQSARADEALIAEIEGRRREGTAREADVSALAAARERLAGNRKSQAACESWRVPCPEDLSLIGLGDVLVAGGSNRVAAFERATGRRVWEAVVEGRVLALAAVNGHLVASTDRGILQAFRDAGLPAAGSPAPGSTTGPAGIAPQARVNPDAARAREASGLLGRLLEAGLAPRGFGLVVGSGSGAVIRELLRRTELQLVVIDPDPERVARLRRDPWFRENAESRVSAHEVKGTRLPFTDYFANLVVSESALEGESRAMGFAEAELERVVRPYGGLRWTDPGAGPARREALSGAGEWTHQFGNPANTASSGDRRIRSELRLQWFGGPGPDAMVDRHLRGPAPLSAGGRLFVPGENRLLAVDAYNGTELWRKDLPGSQRYSMPYDAGYLSVEGETLAVAVRDACWLIRAADGEVLRRHQVPEPASTPGTKGGGWDWGWVVLEGGSLFGSVQKSGASRTQASYEQIDVDYGNEQPLVTGRSVFRLDPATGRIAWERRSGGVINTTLALGAGRVLFVEARSPELASHPTGRIPLGRALAAEPWLVAVDAGSGRVEWERPLDGALRESRNALYLAIDGEGVVLVGSHVTAANDTRYVVERRRLSDGTREWQADHAAGMPGAFTHGEQVHHPVVLGDLLVAEPVVYELKTGRRKPVAWGQEDWRLVRPGHSCGTLSGAGDCLFFRANNPTVLDVRTSLESTAAGAKKLSPSRTGCWINMIPAGGLLLIPEASAGCVCQYSLQTSMAFLPWPSGGR